MYTVSFSQYPKDVDVKLMATNGNHLISETEAPADLNLKNRYAICISRFFQNPWLQRTLNNFRGPLIYIHPDASSEFQNRSLKTTFVIKCLVLILLSKVFISPVLCVCTVKSGYRTIGLKTKKKSFFFFKRFFFRSNPGIRAESKSRELSRRL